MADILGKNIIMIPYADIIGANTGVNLKKTSLRKKIYLENCCVALLSAKHYNPDCTIALVTNTDIPTEYASLLHRNNIEIITAPFDSFSFDNQYTWALAFYKLCALNYVSVHHPHDAYCYLDSDVCIQNDFSAIWEECAAHIMMYDINHGLQVEHYRHFLKEIESFTETPQLITHYGGEFFAANHKNTLLFLEHCHSIYNEMQKKRFVTTHGDEFITSLAAKELGSLIKNAGAYIFRFWTGGFRLVSTCHQNNPVFILHVPAEKEYGMRRLYCRYIRKGQVPKKKTLWRFLHITHRSGKIVAASAYHKLRSKLSRK